MKCDIVIGTMLGDEAKGVVVDNLCNPNSLVVRFSGGQQCGHCQTGDTLIYTVGGLKYLDEMVGDHTTDKSSYSIINKDLNPENTSLLFREENCRINHIVLKNGMIMKCTDKHKYFVWDKNKLSLSWVPYIEIDIHTHQFVFPKKINSYQGSLPSLQNKERVNKNNGKYIDVAQIDYSFLAEYIGLVNGDGIFHKKYVGLIFHKKQKDLMNFVNDNLAKINLHPSIKEHPLTDKCQTLTVYSVDFIDILKEVGVFYTKGENKRTPKFVLCGPKNIQRAYIRGLFETDGCVKYHKIKGKDNLITGRVCFSNTSFYLVNELQNLLYLNGIHSTVSSEQKKGYKQSYTLTISSLDNLYEFSEIIGFRSDYNSKRLQTLLDYKHIIRNNNIGDCVLLNQNAKAEIYSLYAPDKQFRKEADSIRVAIIQSVKNKVSERYNDLLDVVENYHLVKISSKHDNMATDTVFDLTCDATHSYISNGTISHNTVMRDGIKHTFSSFGAGTLQGAGTYFTEHTTLFPKTFLKEYDVLVSKGITPPKVGVHPLTRITTIYDVAYNRASEKVRRTGSCGLGVGATMKRNDETHYNLYACDLENEFVYRYKMGAIEGYYTLLVSKQSKEFFSEYWDQLDELYQDCDVREKERQDFLSKIRVVMFENYYMRFSNIVFEGSQGIQLDMHHGIFPNVTYANTTSKNAIEYLKKYDFEAADVYYVTRCYGTRHGEGPIPNNIKVNLINNEEEINVFNTYQQEFKVFEFDKELVEHAIRIDEIYHDDQIWNKNLVITCIDQRLEWIVPNFNVSLNRIYLNGSPKCGNMFLC